MLFLSGLTGCRPAVNATPATVVVDEVEVEGDREAQLAAYRANVAGFEQKAAETAFLASELNTEILDSAVAKNDIPLANQYTMARWNIPSAIDHVVVHELAHAYYRVVSDPRNHNESANNMFTVYVENMMRSPTAKRLGH